MRFVLLMLALTFALAGCGRRPVDDGRLDLRLYPVPADSTERLRAALERVLVSEDKNRVARVSSPSPGRLLVLAPAELQGSVAAVIEALSKPAKDAGKLPEQVRLRLWTVDASSGPGPDDAALQPLKPALDEVRAVLGPVQFALRDTTAAVSGIGERVERNWPSRAAPDAPAVAISQMQYRTSAAPDGLVLQISIGQELSTASGVAGNPVRISTETTTPLRLGQTLVLSQSPMPPSGAGQPATQTTRLYVVRVDPVSS